MGSLYSNNLEGFLNTNYSSQYAVPDLDSYMYNSRNIPKGYDKIRFYIQTVDKNGKAKTYTSQGQTFIGLVLLINPATMNANLSKIVNRTQTLTGWIEDHWGEELDTVSFSGSGASFLWGGPNRGFVQGPLSDSPEEIRNVFSDYLKIPNLGSADPVGPGDHSGLTVKRRRDTLSYDQFRRIINLMNGQACKYDVRGFVQERLYIEMSYDYAAYRGYFESIDITESSDTPFRFTYIITFKAEKTLYSFLK